MDDLLALFDAAPDPEDLARDSGSPQRSGKNEDHDPERDDNPPPSSSHRASGATTNEQRQAASADAKVGIRMINRVVSGADLLKLLVEHPYHSPASLCAMSLQALSSLLIEPPTVVDPSTVYGRTHLVTVGIVFSNSGTRVSASGNAFCALTLGNLASGPAVSCMLFGPAYSQNCRKCLPGKVVALLGPRVLPAKSPRRNGPAAKAVASSYSRDATAVSLSVSDERHILLVADAQDYGTCPAPVRGKDDGGRWTNDAKRCGHYVDKRVSEYCPRHRKLQRATPGMSAVKSRTTTLQQRRREAILFPKLDSSKRMMNPCTGRTSMASVPVQRTQPVPRSQQMMSLFQKGLVVSATEVRHLTSLSARSPFSQSSNSFLNLDKSTSIVSTAVVPIKKARRHLRKTSPARNRIDPPQQKEPPTPAASAPPDPIVALRSSSATHYGDPRRLMKSSILNPRAPSLISNSLKGAVNPHMKVQPSMLEPVPPVAAASTPSPQLTQTPPDWMKPDAKWKPPAASSLVGTKKSNSTLSTINTDTAHFNGSVPVPQSTQLRLPALRPHGMTVASYLPQPSEIVKARQERQMQEVLERQKALATKLRGGGLEARATACSSTQAGMSRPSLAVVGRRVALLQPEPRFAATANESVTEDDRMQALFGPLNNKVDLEAIRSARSMFADEAAAEEYAWKRNRVVELERKEEVKGRDDAAANDALILKVWFCRTCNRASKAPPRACQRANHTLTLRRSIRESKDPDERRQALSDAKAEDGGLKLGAGLEWSKWNRFS